MVIDPDLIEAITWTDINQDRLHHTAQWRDNELTHCDLVTPYGHIELGQSGEVWCRWQHQAIT